MSVRTFKRDLEPQFRAIVERAESKMAGAMQPHMQNAEEIPGDRLSYAAVTRIHPPGTPVSILVPMAHSPASTESLIEQSMEELLHSLMRPASLHTAIRQT